MRQGTGALNALLIMGIITLGLVWIITSMTNEDMLWFMRSFDAKAEAMTIHWDGESYVVHAGDAGYEAIMNAFAEGISHASGFEWEIAFSEENIRRYREDFRLLEVQFTRPVQVHTRHPFPKAKTYLIPLNATHANSRRVFAFPGIMPYTSGPLNMDEEHFTQLYEAVESVVASQD
ncbi:MAG: hypothetical protein JXA21_09610 [Anaerolineae bacterium]|nr:hypothetical protein [Anaerolineae bacterium]